MSRSIRESDWKHFKKVHRLALKRHCQVTLDRLAVIASPEGKDPHESYLDAYDYIRMRDKEVARAFNDFRRSTAVSHIILLFGMGLILEKDMDGFSEEVLNVVGEFKKE